jgi:transcriptional regulator with XRE-family HTH domain
MDRAALADFLRRRREALRPEDVGLPPGVRRRAPGLRREEVAALAVMSIDYYTRLEQRRGPQPSEQMLASLARALRLTTGERDYLFQVAGHNAPAHASTAAHVAPALLRVLDRLTDTPALILSNLGETLVQNRMAEALFGDNSRYTGLARSEIYRWFTDLSERLRYPEDDRDRQSRAMVANLRAAYGSMGPTSRAGELVRALQKASEGFAGLWDRHEVAKRFEDHKTLVHPEIGPIEVDCQALFTEDQSQTLLVLTAPPQTEGYEKLRLLAVLGQERFTPAPDLRAPSGSRSRAPGCARGDRGSCWSRRHPFGIMGFTGFPGPKETIRGG